MNYTTAWDVLNLGRGLKSGSLNTLAVTGLASMCASQCGNDQPGFGVHSVTQKLSAYNNIRVLNIIKLNYIILYYYNIVYSCIITIFIML